jgi:hypothetical protein
MVLAIHAHRANFCGILHEGALPLQAVGTIDTTLKQRAAQTSLAATTISTHTVTYDIIFRKFSTRVAHGTPLVGAIGNNKNRRPRQEFRNNSPHCRLGSLTGVGINRQLLNVVVVYNFHSLCTNRGSVCSRQVNANSGAPHPSGQA